MDYHEYILAQQKTGLQAGDEVIITGKAKSKENGWGNSWAPDMDSEIGSIGKISLDYDSSAINAENGIPVKTEANTWKYPYWVVTKLPKDQEEYKKGVMKCLLAVGDIVKILKKIPKGTYGYNAEWVSGMDKALGKIGEITNINEYGVKVSVVTPAGKIPDYTYPYFVLQLMENTSPIPTAKDSEDDYVKKQKAFGLKVGDIVKVLKTAKGGEGGWSVGWAPSMTDTVGQELEIINDMGSAGLQLEGGYNYPYFVLEKVEGGMSATVKFQQLMLDSGFKAGDIVKLVAKATTGEQGWKGSWNSSLTHFMLSFGVVVNESSEIKYGFSVYFENGSRFYLPPFVLERAKDTDTDIIPPKIKFMSNMALHPFKPGDVVLVTRKAKTGENGWVTMEWDSSNMDSYIGEQHLVTSEELTMGYELNNSQYFPYFVLKLVPAVSHEEYMKGFALTKFEDGDVVKVIRRIPRGVGGSPVSWDNRMTDSLGKKYLVTHVYSENGSIMLDNGRYYPYSAIEKSTGLTFKQERQKFQKDMNESPIKDGDTIKVLRKAENKEQGWGLDWSPDMDFLVGNEYEVHDKNLEYGFEVIINDKVHGNTTTYIPYFIVERTKIGISRAEYWIQFQKEMQNSPIKIGDVVKIIYKARNREKGWKADWEIPDSIIKKFNQFDVIKKDITYGFTIQGDDEDGYYYAPYFSLEVIENPTISPKKMFIKMMRESPIKIKSVVKVLRKAKTHEKGWQSEWFDPMDDMVGKYYRVVAKNEKKGFTLLNWANDDHWQFPFFVLELSLKNKRLPLSPRMKFAKEVRTSPFKKGTVAKVIKKIASYPGWSGTWDDNMSAMVGQEYLVVKKDLNNGISLYDDEEGEEATRWFPPAALEFIPGSSPHRVPFDPFEGQPIFMDEAKRKRVFERWRLKEFLEDDFAIQEAILDTEMNKLDEVDVQHTFGFPMPAKDWTKPDAMIPEPKTVHIPYYKSDIETWDKLGEADREEWFDEINAELSTIAEGRAYLPDKSSYEDYIESYVENPKAIIKEIVNDYDFIHAFDDEYGVHFNDVEDLVVKFLKEHEDDVVNADMGISLNGDESTHSKIVIAQFDDENYGEGDEPIELPEELLIKLKSIPEEEIDNISIKDPEGVYNVDLNDDFELQIEYKTPNVVIYMEVSTAMALLSDNDFSLGSYTPPPEKHKTVPHQIIQNGPPEEIDPNFDPFEGEPMFGKED